ncbi:MAG: DUF4294 domain-containing protein [Bacteroidota bacterium]|jgi:hypothetical protein|nr:DUF4294 domain-containing protein [Chitinophagaceae bacterium]
MRKLLIILLIGIVTSANAQWKAGQNDTLWVPYIIYEGDTMTYKVMDLVNVFGKMTDEQRAYLKKWTRLRNAVYVTYPYAKKASYIINDVVKNLDKIQDVQQRKKYLSTREKELKKEFTEPLTALSVYQGKILMKLINRETHNNCYDLIKEYRGGFTARFWQTVAWVFGSSLKQDYDPKGPDAEMESIVLEVARMYGHA